MSYELTGTIKEIFPLQTFSSGFTKREFVVTVPDERFPQDIKLDCLKEKADLLESFSNGDEVKVSFNLRGREYNGRYYVDLNAWKIESAGSSPEKSSSNKNRKPKSKPVEAEVDESLDGEDVPF